MILRTLLHMHISGPEKGVFLPLTVVHMRISGPDKGVFPTLTLVTANASQLNHDTRLPIQVKIVCNYYFQVALHSSFSLEIFPTTNFGIEQGKNAFLFGLSKLFHC